MTGFKVKNWKRFQHFKDRSPPWIKLYRDLLDDPDWHQLDGNAAKFLVMLWLVASEDKDKEGKLPDMRKLAFRLHMEEHEVKALCSRLSHWLDQVDIKLISDGYQLDAPETETETEKTSCAVSPHEAVSKDELDGFSECWNAYPKRQGGNSRKEAGKAYRARVRSGVLHADLLAGVQRYAAFIRATGKEGSAYVKQAATFFGTGEHWLEAWEVGTLTTDNQPANHFKGAI